VSCFTATAKPQVVQDIQAYFRDKLGLPLRVFKAPGRRHNLTYNVQRPAARPSTGGSKASSASSDRPKIIYVSRVKTAEDLAESLTRDGLKALPYHGQMDSNQKVRNQDQFIRSEVNTIVATTAFGMGVDKNNVEMVIHYEISDSLENYVQEAGRAGRSEDIEAAATCSSTKTTWASTSRCSTPPASTARRSNKSGRASSASLRAGAR
jgi:ATP-dependent DNA helicase RecQ